MADQSQLTAALAGYLTELGQRGWRTALRHRRRSGMSLIHGRRKHTDGVDEILVAARLHEDRVRVRRYVLLWNEQEWRTCDQPAFQGYLTEGAEGLDRGRSRTKPTVCSCGWRVHRSERRALQFAEGSTQRAYPCSENPRAFHLTYQPKGARGPAPKGTNRTT